MQVLGGKFKRNGQVRVPNLTQNFAILGHVLFGDDKERTKTGVVDQKLTENVTISVSRSNGNDENDTN